MSDSRVLRFLQFLRRTLKARDARLEFGGAEPDGDDVLWTGLPNGWRVVALFDEPLVEREKRLRHLQTVVNSFQDVLRASGGEQPSSSEPPVHHSDRLEEALEALAVRAAALDAVVIDVRSPTIWGSSFSHAEREDMEWARRALRTVELAEAVGVELAPLLSSDPDVTARRLGGDDASQEAERLLIEVAALRSADTTRTAAYWHRYLTLAAGMVKVQAESEKSLILSHGNPSVVAKRFANLYWLVAVFDGPYSELHAEGALLRALPVVEQLVLALPPVDPPPAGAKVIRLKR